MSASEPNERLGKIKTLRKKRRVRKTGVMKESASVFAELKGKRKRTGGGGDGASRVSYGMPVTQSGGGKREERQQETGRCDRAKSISQS